jgi:endonuclease YncB( thermonuclease family)
VKTIRSLSQSVWTFIMVPALMLSSAVLGQETVVHGRVVSVTDGDTLKILVAGQELLRVRIAFAMPQRNGKRSVPVPNSR